MLIIVSGGQTGVDRAALDAALEYGVEIEGWCPRGRLAEDGVLPLRYPLNETKSSDYSERTRLNVRDSDGTMILSRGKVLGGSLLTQKAAIELRRPLLIADPARENVRNVLEWINSNGIRRLNVAGPRESEAPGIYVQAARFIGHVLRLTAEGW